MGHYIDRERQNRPGDRRSGIRACGVWSPPARRGGRGDETTSRHVSSLAVSGPARGDVGAGPSLTNTHASSKALLAQRPGRWEWDRSIGAIGMDDDATAALLGGADTDSPVARAGRRGTARRRCRAPPLQAARGAAAGTRDPHGAHPQGPRSAPRRAPLPVVVSLFPLRRSGGSPVPRGAADLRCTLRPLLWAMGYGHAGRHCSASGVSCL